MNEINASKRGRVDECVHVDNELRNVWRVRHARLGTESGRVRVRSISKPDRVRVHFSTDEMVMITDLGTIISSDYNPNGLHQHTCTCHIAFTLTAEVLPQFCGVGSNSRPEELVEEIAQVGGDG
ncbi:uncharacterized protein LOC131219034 [Magnolia sinica]|uniref:uncharacterized protein LOC131219034 n=1 Tax=Magnolia sinica TaxID=86752 RepID=UPI002658C1BE|nr:uncharacterized protein LOC131219034 [Magnolia sinica]